MQLCHATQDFVAQVATHADTGQVALHDVDSVVDTSRHRRCSLAAGFRRVGSSIIAIGDSSRGAGCLELSIGMSAML